MSKDELTKALNFIEKNYEMSALVGLDVCLLGVGDDDVENIIKASLVINPNRLDKQKSLNIKPSDKLTHDDMLNYIDRITNPFVIKIIHQIVESSDSLGKVAGLYALYDFKRECRYSEIYEQCFEEKNKN